MAKEGTKAESKSRMKSLLSQIGVILILAATGAGIAINS
jgi:hypothetical protein